MKKRHKLKYIKKYCASLNLNAYEVIFNYINTQVRYKLFYI